jgi:hypothetical protein
MKKHPVLLPIIAAVLILLAMQVSCTSPSGQRAKQNQLQAATLIGEITSVEPAMENFIFLDREGFAYEIDPELYRDILLVGDTAVLSDSFSGGMRILRFFHGERSTDDYPYVLYGVDSAAYVIDLATRVR